MRKIKNVVIEKLNGSFDEFQDAQYTIYNGVVCIYNGTGYKTLANYSMCNIVCVYYEEEK